MSEIGQDPGVGEPAGIRALARERSAKAVELRGVHAEVVAAEKAVAGSAWTGKAQAAFSTTLDAVAPDLLLLARGLEAQATALHAYAGQVQQIKDQQRVLEAQRRSARDALTAAQAQLAASHRADDRVLAQEQALDRDVRSSSILASRARHTERIADETARLAHVDTEWEHLVVWRRRVDQACMAALSGPEVLGKTAPFTPTVIRTSTPDALLTMLTGLSATDLAALLETHPELTDKHATADPNAVATWWTSMNGEDPGTPSAEQLALITGIPAIIGALNGVPALARVAANRTSADARLPELAERLKRLLEAEEVVEGLTGRANSVNLDEIKRLQNEIEYLNDVRDGKVQLYLYEPANSRVIEMIGTPSAATRHVVTYVPGTFTNLDAFYSRGVQQIGHFLGDERDDIVAFVYKDGKFPGGTETSSAANLLGILEANDQGGAARAGAKLAEFQKGIDQDMYLAASNSTAIGHSWGLTNVTSSETEGARYQQVISLSGAWMPTGWQPHEGTRYSDFSYDDILQVAQRGGLVGKGNVPRAHPAFEHGEYYQAPGDVYISAPGGDVAHYSNPADLLNNHNLIASDDKENRRVLAHINDKVLGK